VNRIDALQAGVYLEKLSKFSRNGIEQIHIEP